MAKEKIRILVVDDNAAIHASIKSILQEKSLAQQRKDSPFNMLFSSENNRNPDNKLDKGEGQEATENLWFEEIDFDIVTSLQGENGFTTYVDAKEKNKSFDLIVCDMRMPPGWDGMKTMAEISKIDPGALIIMCSAYSDYTFEQVMNNVGTLLKVTFFDKPIDPQEFTRLIHKKVEWILALRKDDKIQV